MISFIIDLVKLITSLPQLIKAIKTAKIPARFRFLRMKDPQTAKVFHGFMYLLYVIEIPLILSLAFCLMVLEMCYGMKAYLHSTNSFYPFFTVAAISTTAVFFFFLIKTYISLSPFKLNIKISLLKKH